MVKADLLRRLKAEFPEYTASDLKDVLDLIFEHMCQSLCACNRIEIRGFGSFVVRPQKEREFINPKNGKKTYYPKRYRIVFRPGKKLRKTCQNFSPNN